MRHLVYAGAFTWLCLLAPSQALAWCRTTTCDQTPQPPGCGTIDANGCSADGKRIAWPSTCVSTSVSSHGSLKAGISAADMRQVVADAFLQWTTADCGGGQTPKFVVDFFPDVNCTEVTGNDEVTGKDRGFKTEGPNYNVWIFRDSDWVYGLADENAIAITTTQFSPTTGVIFDSDVELNSQSQDFSIGLDVVRMDLPSVVQHEAGHFLGLAHSQAANATMLPSLDMGDVTRRTLEQDDIDGICAAYPPGKLDPNCDPEPRHGFSTECSFDNGCSVVAAGRGNRKQRVPTSLLIGSLLAVVVVRRKRNHRSEALDEGGAEAGAKAEPTSHNAAHGKA